MSGSAPPPPDQWRPPPGPPPQPAWPQQPAQQQGPHGHSPVGPYGWGGYQPPVWEQAGGVRPSSIRTLGGWVQGLLWASLATFALLTATMFFNIFIVADYHAGRATTADVVAGEEAIGIVLILLVAPVFLAAAALWLVWQHRVHRQLVALRGSEPFRYSAGLGVGCWFIPAANLVMPLLEVSDLWRASSRPDAPAPEPVALLVKWWWALFVGVPTAWVLVTFLYGFAEGMEVIDMAVVEPTWMVGLATLAWASVAAAAGLGARVATNISRRTCRLSDAAGWGR